MKKCNRCNIEQELKLFCNDKSSKDGHKSICKACNRSYRIKNKDRDKEYRLLNKDKRREYNKNRDKKAISKAKAIYYELNRDEIINKRKSHYNKNRDRKIEYQKQYQQNNKEKRNKYLSERRESDPLFRLITNIRNLINNSFYEMNYSKISRTQDIIGCSFEELKNHLEFKWESWMNWENRGLYNGELNFGWDIDHITPLSFAKTEEELVLLNHYTNLQPLCSKINRDIKRNNIDSNI